jgi:hypothetical protein
MLIIPPFQKTTNKSGPDRQREDAGEVQAVGIMIRLQWVPRHCDKPEKTGKRDRLPGQKTIRSARYSPGRDRKSAVTPLPSGSKNGDHPPKVVICGRSITSCPQPAPGDLVRSLPRNPILSRTSSLTTNHYTSGHEKCAGFSMP